MKIALLILIASCCTLANSEYPRMADHGRYKNRGPPYPPRHPPPMPPYMKKWNQPPHYPKRMPPPPQNRPARPIPIHMPPGHMNNMNKGPPQQQMLAQSQHRPSVVAPPMRNFYKNPQPPPSVKYPAIPEKQHYIQKEKPQFLSSPPIPAPNEYDYHIQSNSIPTHTTPIKQVGEKGPIHTIPAPNLSLKDKPIVVEEVRKPQEYNYQQNAQSQEYNYQQNQNAQSQEYNYQQNQNVQLQYVHQYQVTEPNEPMPKASKIFGTQNIEIQPQQLYYVPEQNVQQQQQQQQPQSLPLKGQPSELSFRVVGSIPQMQTQAIQSTFVQQQPQVNYQLLNQQLFQAEPVFQNQEASVGPDFQSFNYDEQAHQKQQALSRSELSGLVTAAYNLAEKEEHQQQQQQQISSRSGASIDPLTQAQIVQSYFDTRPADDENVVEADAMPGEKKQQEEQQKEEEEMMETSQHFASLPNKEAAERLAQLQAAGNINSHLMKIPPKQVYESKDPMTIYVPEDDEESREDQSLEYDDYAQEEEDRKSSEEAFGQRLKHRN